jgi:hypothetical protein
MTWTDIASQALDALTPLVLIGCTTALLWKVFR